MMNHLVYFVYIPVYLSGKSLGGKKTLLSQRVASVTLTDIAKFTFINVPIYTSENTRNTVNYTISKHSMFSNILSLPN